MKIAVIDPYGSGAVYEIDEELESVEEIKEKGKLICQFDSNISED